MALARASAPARARPRSRARARGTPRARGTRRDDLLELQRAFEFVDQATGTRVRRARDDDVRACVDVIVDAFSETEDAKPRAYVLRYVIGLTSREDPEEVALAATDGTSGEVIGFITVSITSRTRPVEGDSRMAPPSDAAYVGNACVRRDRRRRGTGRALVRAAERLTTEMGGCDCWLHVRAGEDAAVGLYRESGYVEVERERVFRLAGLFGGKAPSPRVLMRKELRSDGSCNFML